MIKITNAMWNERIIYALGNFKSNVCESDNCLARWYLKENSEKQETQAVLNTLYVKKVKSLDKQGLLRGLMNQYVNIPSILSEFLSTRKTKYTRGILKEMQSFIPGPLDSQGSSDPKHSQLNRLIGKEKNCEESS